MAGPYLIDTDLIVEYLRGRDQAVSYMESLKGSLYVSAITIAELYSGVREDEREALERFLNAFEVVDVDEAIACEAGLCRRDHRPAHGTGLADAIIAVSTKSVGATLVTFNARHYPMVDDIVVPYRRD